MNTLEPVEEVTRHDNVLEGEVIPMMTHVFNLATGQGATFSLPPARAVVAAYEQFTRGNHNTWNYLDPVAHPEFVKGKLSVACGDWAASTRTH